MNDKTKGLLRIARKAGLLIIGYDNIIKTKKPVYLLITAKNVSERTKKNILQLDKERIDTNLDKIELGALFGAGEVALTGVTDEKLAENIKKSNILGENEWV